MSENENTYSLDEDQELIDFLSMEQKNTSDTFKDYTPTKEFVSNVLDDFYASRGIERNGR